MVVPVLVLQDRPQKLLCSTEMEQKKGWLGRGYSWYTHTLNRWWLSHLEVSVSVSAAFTVEDNRCNDDDGGDSQHNEDPSFRTQLWKAVTGRHWLIYIYIYIFEIELKLLHNANNFSRNSYWAFNLTVIDSYY